MVMWNKELDGIIHSDHMVCISVFYFITANVCVYVNIRNGVCKSSKIACKKMGKIWACDKIT